VDFAESRSAHQGCLSSSMVASGGRFGWRKSSSLVLGAGYLKPLGVSHRSFSFSSEGGKEREIDNRMEGEREGWRGGGERGRSREKEGEEG
jgi:hypothetical protein